MNTNVNMQTSTGAASGWGDVFLQAIKVAVVAFIVLQLKEWVDASSFDTPAAATDAALIAGGVLVLSAVIKLVRGR